MAVRNGWLFVDVGVINATKSDHIKGTRPSQALGIIRSLETILILTEAI